MQEESVLKPNIPQGEHIPTEDNRSGLFEKQSGASSFSRKKNFHGKNQFYQRESVRRRMIKKFFKLVGTMVGVFLLAGTIAVFIINGSQASHENALAGSTSIPSAAASSPPSEGAAAATRPSAEPSDSILLPPAKTNFLVVGKDVSGLLTDVMIVGCFNRETYEVSLISIPRDTLTIIPPERLQRMNELGLYMPSGGAMKLNEVNSYGQQQYGMAILQEQIQDMLGIDIEYQIEVNLQAFRNIIDDLGGVYFEIPKPGMYYDDPYQELHIAIPPGIQYLDGKNAEGVVRFRDTYRDGDIQRIGVQQEFLKALFSQVLERKNILGNAFSITKSIISYTKTNLNITDVPKYLRYINDISADNFHFYTLPCTPEYIGKVSYVIPNEEQIQELVKDVFYKVTKPEGTPSETVPEVSAQPTGTLEISSKGLSIEILNGSGKTGIAGSFKDTLESDGFTITRIDNYSGVQMDKTQIIVRTAGMGSDLAHYFIDTDIQVFPDLPADYDIVIITGRGEA
ncbi:MAG: LCP family protein [Clostridiales bacterium]|jgi:LCP family protein required for cell wall assembly|nr:LCP family protein [Clostridiales bacterium]